MSNHTLRLHPGPFTAITAGHKTIECRLFDEKRRALAIGDQMTFISRTDQQQVDVHIIGLVRAQTFAELFTHIDSRKCGNASSRQLLAELAEFYSLADQQRYGVLGIEFERS